MKEESGESMVRILQLDGKCDVCMFYIHAVHSMTQLNNHDTKYIFKMVFSLLKY